MIKFTTLGGREIILTDADDMRIEIYRTSAFVCFKDPLDGQQWDCSVDKITAANLLEELLVDTE